MISESRVVTWRPSEAQVVLVGFPRAIGYAYYPVRVEPATEDPNAWWGSTRGDRASYRQLVVPSDS